MQLPKVSVIIPVYNGARIIEGCLKCLLAQQYPCELLEILVVDNNSTDQTAAIVKSFGLTCLVAEIQGPSAARNLGMKVATGEMLLLIDADCLAAPDLVLCHVLKHLYFAEVAPEVKLIAGGISGDNTNFWAVCDDLTSWAANHPCLPEKFVSTHPTANLSLRRELVSAGYFFDEALRSGEDYDFCTQLVRAGYRIFFEPRAVVAHINRTTFQALMKHTQEWTRSEYRLREKGTTGFKEHHLLVWYLKYAAIYLILVAQNLRDLWRARRFHGFFFLPWIMLNKLCLCWYLLQADLEFSRVQARRRASKGESAKKVRQERCLRKS